MITDDLAQRPPDFWILLPVFNEGKEISELLIGLRQALKGLNYQLVIVDDGSTDDSFDTVVDQHRLSIIHHSENQGLGRAILTGFNAILNQVDDGRVIVMDADGTHEPSYIESLLEQNADVVIASRYQRGSRVVGLSRYRLMLSHGSSWLFRLFCPVQGVKDYTCGFRAYRIRTLKQAFDYYGEQFITEAGFTCMAEILIKLVRFGATTTEIPFTLRYDYKISTSKMRVFLTIMRSLLLLLSYRFKKKSL